MYKIKIDCTTQKDLTINNKKINIRSFSNSGFNINDFSYISKIAILYEDNLHSRNEFCYITKTLEFFCNKEITREEFVDFITHLRSNGFVSRKREPKIQFIDNDGKIIYNYNYNLVFPFHSNSVKSIQKYQNLFVKHNIT